MRRCDAFCTDSLTARSISALYEARGKTRRDRTMDTIEGTWRFVRAVARDDVGNPRPSPYEGRGMGRIVIGSGRMAVMMIDWRHELPGDQKRRAWGRSWSCYSPHCTLAGCGNSTSGAGDNLIRWSME